LEQNNRTFDKLSDKFFIWFGAPIGPMMRAPRDQECHYRFNYCGYSNKGMHSFSGALEIEMGRQ